MPLWQLEAELALRPVEAGARDLRRAAQREEHLQRAQIGGAEGARVGRDTARGYLRWSKSVFSVFGQSQKHGFLSVLGSASVS